MNEERRAILEELQTRLGYWFHNQELLNMALTHRSFACEQTEKKWEDNERLEFLGDAVLSLCIANLIYNRFPHEDEGQLSKRRAACVNEKCLARLAKSLLPGEALILGKGEEMTGGREKNSVLANTFEALIAAVYLDGGLGASISLVERLFGDLLDRCLGDYCDYKSLLQEKCQNRFRSLPRYNLVQVQGPDHNRTFTVNLHMPCGVVTQGIGKNRKEAEQDAARKALSIIENEQKEA